MFLVLCGLQKFQDAMSRVDVMSDYLMQTLFETIVPIYDFHCGLLKELDQRLAVWSVEQLNLKSAYFKSFMLIYQNVNCSMDL